MIFMRIMFQNNVMFDPLLRVLNYNVVVEENNYQIQTISRVATTKYSLKNASKLKYGNLMVWNKANFKRRGDTSL